MLRRATSIRSFLENLIVALDDLQDAAAFGIRGRAIPGIGARVSRTSRPEPDVMILPKPTAARRR